MNQNKSQKGANPPNKGQEQDFDKDQPASPGGRPNRDRSEVDDQGLRRKPDSEPAIPELPEPDVEGVGNEGRGNKWNQDREKHTEGTMPPGEGHNPKRNTL
jgi:hypothetical protein